MAESLLIASKKIENPFNLSIPDKPKKLDTYEQMQEDMKSINMVDGKNPPEVRKRPQEENLNPRQQRQVEMLKKIQDRRNS